MAGDLLKYTDSHHVPGPNSAVSWDGRVRFFERIRVLAPQVIYDLRRFKGEVDAWAERWWLTPVDPERDHWPRAVALTTFAHWTQYPEIVRRIGPHWAFPSHQVLFPFSRTEEAAWQEVRESKRRSREYAALAQRRGFERTPVLHEPEAFRRLVRYQVLGWSLAELCGETPDSHRILAAEPARIVHERRKVSKRLHYTADLIGLRLRPPGKPGPRA